MKKTFSSATIHRLINTITNTEEAKIAAFFIEVAPFDEGFIAMIRAWAEAMAKIGRSRDWLDIPDILLERRHVSRRERIAVNSRLKIRLKEAIEDSFFFLTDEEKRSLGEFFFQHDPTFFDLACWEGKSLHDEVGQKNYNAIERILNAVCLEIGMDI